MHICYKLTAPEVVYDVKCLLDKLLDTVENISDVLINSIRPLLALCSQDTLKVACKSGLSLLGICIFLAGHLYLSSSMLPPVAYPTLLYIAQSA